MITIPGYVVMGEDGNEYGPNTTEQIRAWVKEQRLDAKTPVKHSDARDWVFLGSLPEFADLFAPPPPPPPKVPPRKGLVITAVIVALVTIAYFLLKHFHQ